MELTIAQKLDALLQLQSFDSQLDELIKIRGGLPEEVRDLEDDIAGFETRVGKFQAEIKTLEEEIEQNRVAKKDAEKLITKYKDQQMNVRNNREFDAISKEIELQSLEIELIEKRVNESQFRSGARTKKSKRRRQPCMSGRKI